MKCNNYTVVDDSRIQKAKKIISCLEFVITEGLKNKIILEIGAGSGLISYEITKYSQKVISLDIQYKSVQKMQARARNQINFFISNGKELQFKSNSFDIVICNQVIEHIRKQYHQKFIEESYRVLKPNGIFYIATPNKLWPIEPHTKIPLLSFLPKIMADKYMKLVKGINEYNIYLLTYNELSKILSLKYKFIINMTPIIIKNPKKFYIKDEIQKLIKPLLKRIPLDILQLFNPFFPSWILIGIKK